MSDLIERLEAPAGEVENAMLCVEAAARIRVLEGEREHLLNAHVQSFALLNECRDWLSQCADWMLSNDLDMTCPMQTDPEGIVERIDAHAGVVKLGRAA